MSLSGEAKSAAVKDPSAASEHPLHISLLGEFSLRHNEQTLSLDTPSYQSLLAYLVIHAHRHHSRQQLAFQFWPDSNESQARTNLRGALYILRQTLPDADCFLTASRQTVQWRLDAPCVVDAWEFQTAVSQAQQTPSPADQQSYLQQAIAVYHGDLLPGFYDDWVLSVREVLRPPYLTTLEKLLSLFENRRHYAEAIEVARKLLREDLAIFGRQCSWRFTNLSCLLHTLAAGTRRRSQSGHPGNVRTATAHGSTFGAASPNPPAPRRPGTSVADSADGMETMHPWPAWCCPNCRRSRHWQDAPG
jgi:hypothetical protein